MALPTSNTAETHMFEQLKKRTVELLAEKANNFPFEFRFGDNGEEREFGPMAEKEYDSPEGIARLGMTQGELMPVLNQIFDQERLCHEDELFSLDGRGDERLLQLHKCRKKLQELAIKREKSDQILDELGEKYNAVTEKTNSLHTACDRMMSEQTQLAAASEQIGANLHYYQQYDWLLKKLATSKLSLTGTLFTQILSTIHECISYLRAHPEQKEADAYLQKYEQCLSRSLTAVKAGVLSDLESCRQDVLFRQTRSAQQNQHPQRALSYVDNDDTFALLYGVFGVKANAIRNAFSQAHQFFADHAEYQAIVAECEHEYFAVRQNLLRPIVVATIQSLCQRHQNSSCTLTRDGCTFLLRLCDDEFRLYRQFFVLGGVGDTSTRASMTPATPSLFFQFWLSQSAQSNQFHSFIESLCRVFYDTLRPLIIHNPHLETLAQLCTLLKVEMIDERCGVPVPQHAPISSTATSLASENEILTESIGNPRAGFVRVMGELVADIVERIVYRTSLFAQSDILDYNPASGDLMYPERLLMMREIDRQKHSPVKEEGDNVDKESPQKTIKSASSATNLASTSPIDQHCLWYPTVKRTVMCLSKLYRCLDPTVFLNISRELLDACCQSLERAVDRIRILAIEPAKSTVRGCSNRKLDAELFVVKHLLILREQTSPYRQHKKMEFGRPVSQPPLSRSNSLEAQINPQLDYSLDLTKYGQSVLQLLNSENRARWFEFGSNNALLSLLLLTPVHVSELQTDSRRIIESHLKRWCHSMIGHVSALLLGPLATIHTDLEQLQVDQEQRAREQKSPLDVARSERFSPKALHDRCSEAFKHLKKHWPEVRAAFALYIGVKETEEILLQPIRKSVGNAFSAVYSFADRHYGEEQRLIISAPSQEQIWLILNSSV